MRSLPLATLCIACLAGCASIRNPVAMPDLRPPDQMFLVDRTPPDGYPGFMVAEGNIYSCRYGIRFQTAREFDPPKGQMLAALLAEFSPRITQHEVMLERFDVYYNQRPKMLRIGHAAGVAALAGAGVYALGPGSSGDIHEGMTSLDKLLVDSSPKIARHPAGEQVGCADANEGEYYASEIAPGHDVVVTWLKLEINGMPYHFRTFYQFRPADKSDVSAGISEAIRRSVKAVAERIELP